LDASGKDAAALTLKTPSKGIPFTLTLTCPPH
jgi:hypothetical protein